MAKTLTREQKIAKYKITIPEGTDQTVVDLLISKYEDAEKLQAENKSQSQELAEAKELAAQQEKELLSKENDLADRVGGFGTFKHASKEYVITSPRCRMLNGDVLTAQKILDSKTLQSKLVDMSSGVIALKSKWTAERTKLSKLAKRNREIAEKATMKIVDTGN